jgi:iron complex transport system permease protein
MTARRRRIGGACVLVALVLSSITALCVGPSMLPASHAVRVLLAELPGLHNLDADVDPQDHAIVLNLRLPRLVLALLVGCGLAVAGCVMQSFFQNPMAEPSIVGVSAGATLGATLAMILGFNVWIAGLNPVPLAAFIGALIATAVVYLLSRRGGHTPVTVLLLTGVAVASFSSAISAVVLLRGQRGDMDQVIYWMMGSLANRGWPEVRMIVPYVVFALAATYIYGRDLNVLLLGDETARYLGIEVDKVKLVLLALSSLLAASAVSVSGIIGFVGLIVPHIMRLLVGPDHRVLLPFAAAGGAIVLILADVAANLAGEIPVGVVTAFIGCPFFLYLLHRRREYDV